jgi:hypothetical protein
MTKVQRIAEAIEQLCAKALHTSPETSQTVADVAKAAGLPLEETARLLATETRRIWSRLPDGWMYLIAGFDRDTGKTAVLVRKVERKSR